MKREKHYKFMAAQGGTQVLLVGGGLAYLWIGTKGQHLATFSGAAALRKLAQAILAEVPAPCRLPRGPWATRMKPSALMVLGRLQKGPATNKALADLVGFRYGARIHELRSAGHQITVTAPGPTKGVRLYTLLAGVSAPQTANRHPGFSESDPGPAFGEFGAEAGSYRR